MNKTLVNKIRDEVHILQMPKSMHMKYLIVRNQ